mgnify:CR=1 FL=1
MTTLATAPEVARSIADVLEASGLSSAIGGAIALGFYAVPRATVDVDVNVFVAPQEAELGRALAALASAGFEPDDDARRVLAQAMQEGQFRGRIAGMRVDVFVPAIPYYGELSERRRAATLLGREVWILGPEDLVVLKMMFYRRKDLADVEALLRDQGRDFDFDFARRKLAELAGEDDERLQALDQILRDAQASD